MNNKNFNLLVGSQLFSVLGTTIIQFVISLYVLDITKSSLLFSIITSLSIFGKIISLPFCGILADKLHKKKLMIFMDFSYLLLSVGLFLGTNLSNSIFVIGALTTLLGIASAFETPVVQSSIPLICSEDKIPQANGVISSIGMLGNIIGPILAGVIYRFDYVYQIFGFCIVLFILAILCECFLSINELPKLNQGLKIVEIIKEDFKEVFRYLKVKNIILKICFVAFLLNLFLSSFIQVLIPFISRVNMNISDEKFGLMNTCFAIGGLAGSMIYGALSKKLDSSSISKLLVLSSLLFCLLIFPLGIMKNSILSFSIMVGIISIILCLVTIVSVQLVVYIQIISDKRLLGRIVSFVMLTSTLAIPFGQLLYGFVGGYMTKGNLIFVITLLSFVTVLISVYSNSIFKQMEVSKN